MRLGAFRSYPIVRIEALVRVDELVVLAAFRRAGFKKEGVMRGVIASRRTFKDASIVSALSHG
jgi:RimJ/RimL family protein N-acetyltransferase